MLGVALLLLLQDGHRDFGQVVEHEVVDRPTLDLAARAPRASRPRSPGRWRRGPRDRRRIVRTQTCGPSQSGAGVGMGGSTNGPRCGPGFWQRGAQREREHGRACPRDSTMASTKPRAPRSGRRAGARSRRAWRRPTRAPRRDGCTPGLLRLLERAGRAPPAPPLSPSITRHAPGRPGEDEVGVEALPRHRVVAGARGVVDREHDLGHARAWPWPRRSARRRG